MASSDSRNVPLPSPPYDSISKVRFSPTNPDHLLASSWDTSVRFYQTGDQEGRGAEQKARFDHRAAVLDCCFQDKGHAFSGGLDTSVRYIDLETEHIQPLGSHSDAISSMVYSPDINALITGSWDRTVRVWDPRSSPSQQPRSTATTPERVYVMDMAPGHTTLVVGMASRLFHLYDVKKLPDVSQERESALRYMTRSLAVMTTGEGFAVGSVEGRIAVEYFDESLQQQKYAFKCHRQAVGTVDHVWPVNALAFHPTHQTFASGGSDGTVSIWDHKQKKRLRHYQKINTNPVSSIAFSCDGAKMAVSTCYTWDQGENGLKNITESPMIYIRHVGDEVKPKEK